MQDKKKHQTKNGKSNHEAAEPRSDNSLEQLTEEIRKRAHQLFLERGGSPGDPQGDWLRAEREVKGRFGAHETRK
jgi:hypothetical protein